tara:strand:+ start:64 stop:186 length:123 start_codon:yes stop_codon:yes gene_type:complete
MLSLKYLANEKEKNHSLKKGDVILFGSVGAGMNVKAILRE